MLGATVESAWFAMPGSERLSWTPDTQFHTGDTVALALMAAHIMAVTPDGRPARVNFVFRESIDAIAFMRLNKDGPVLYGPPQTGSVRKLYCTVYA